jgi:hypothetical protein
VLAENPRAGENLRRRGALKTVLFQARVSVVFGRTFNRIIIDSLEFSLKV